MDFVKALMLYMSLTVAAGIEAAPTPGTPPTPSPTPVPTAIVSTVTPKTTSSVIGSLSSSDAPADMITPTPAPTITPNQSYHTLRVGSKGKDVRKVQERLIELGYLNGNADGTYGNQTKNAIIKFQHANRLVADGVAGVSTQTILFEAPDVMPNTAKLTPTPIPTATPDINGFIPLPDNPTSLWSMRQKAKVLLNGKQITFNKDKKKYSPRVWLRGKEIIVSLDELASAAGWPWTSIAGDAFTLSVAGHELAGHINPAMAASYAVDLSAYRDLFDVKDGNKDAGVKQGEIMTENSEWFVSEGFITRVLGGEVTWDADEGILLLKIPQKDAAHSSD